MVVPRSVACVISALARRGDHRFTSTMEWRNPAHEDYTSVVLLGELRTGDWVVRGITPDDAAALARLATRIGYEWGDLLSVPGSEQDTLNLIREWESLRATGQADLVGMFGPDGTPLFAVAVRRHDLTAELSGWGTAIESERKVSMQGIALWASYLRDSCDLVRLWIDAPPHDRHTDFLTHLAGFRSEGTVTKADGTTRERISFL